MLSARNTPVLPVMSSQNCVWGHSKNLVMDSLIWLDDELALGPDYRLYLNKT